MDNQNNSFFANLFYQLPQNIASLYKGKNILWQILAIVITYVAVITGFDWRYFLFFRGTLIFTILFPAVGVGFLVPVFLPLVALIVGTLQKNAKTLIIGCALMQASFLGWLFSTIYKVFTGRSGPPEMFGVTHLTDISHGFKIGLFRGGVFWGWPSSHTTTAFALAVTVIVLFPKNWYIKTLALVYALYVGLGVSMSIHWFSDFAAGAIFGTLIGIAVGSSFLKKLPPSATR